MADTLIRIDPRDPRTTVPHCVRCRDPLEPGARHLEPGPFCAACIDDMFASAESFGGAIGDVAGRYNAKLASFAAAGTGAGRRRTA
jgi:hypothetical protein